MRNLFAIPDGNFIEKRLDSVGVWLAGGRTEILDLVSQSRYKARQASATLTSGFGDLLGLDEDSAADDSYNSLRGNSDNFVKVHVAESGLLDEELAELDDPPVLGSNNHVLGTVGDGDDLYVQYLPVPTISTFNSETKFFRRSILSPNPYS